MGKKIHCHVSVPGLLTQDGHSLRRTMGTFLYDGRHPRNVAEYRSMLAELLADGIKCLPVGEPCEGFSYQTGCPGHETGEAMKP